MAGETILIVEDRRENIVHLANNILKPNGYEVLTAMDGQRGLKRILSDKPDLVIMDLNMPRMDGLEVLAALQERGDKTPVILTTFYGSEQVAQQAMHLGAIDYVVKPYQIDTMLTAVRKALARRHPASPPPPPASPPSTLDPDHAPERAMPLTRQVERWMRDMNILARVGKALVALLDLDRIVMRAVEAAIYVTRADYAFLYLQDPHTGGLRLRGARGPRDPRAQLMDMPVDSGLAIEVMALGETEIRAKAPGDVTLFEIVGQSMGPMIAAPLRWQSRTIGVLIAARNPGEAPFGEYDTEWLSGLADYAIIAVQNARAYEAQKPRGPQPCMTDEQAAALRAKLVKVANDMAATAASLLDVIDILPGEVDIE
ncbi:MAG: response regulator [Anaerolineae bacterium]|nr:response regulator [Anaerolineae bacterium]